MNERLGVGIVGSGFVANFHVQSWVGVRHADIVGIYSRNRATADALAAECRGLGVGDPTTTDDLVALVRDPRVQAIWMAAPNHVRVEMVEAICEEVAAGRAELTAIAIEKPLARTLREAKRVADAVDEAGIIGWLPREPGVCPGPHAGAGDHLGARRFDCRGAVSGPLRRGALRAPPRVVLGWPAPGWRRAQRHDVSLRRGRSAPAHAAGHAQVRVAHTDLGHAGIAALKWTRPAFAQSLAEEYGDQVDYHNHPAEDYARATFTFRNGDGDLVVAEATTSWSYVGAGLRLSFELLGPEYSMQVNSLETPAKIFLSRALQGEEGEDLVEKQNAEQGLMPVIEDEALTYGYTHENRHMVEAFRSGTAPSETLRDGVAVSELLMAAYLSAEVGESIESASADLYDFVPKVAQGRWDPRAVHR